METNHCLCSGHRRLIVFYIRNSFLSHSKSEPTNTITKTTDSLFHLNRIQVLLDGEEAISLDKNNAEIRLDERGAIIVDEKLTSVSKKAVDNYRKALFIRIFVTHISILTAMMHAV